MKLVQKNIDNDKSGSITVCPDDNEDMWTCFNVIRNGDIIEGKTQRKVVQMSKDGSKITGSTKKIVKLTVKIEKIDYDAAGGELRMKGKTLYDQEDVPSGSYHTFQLEPGKNIKIKKEEWDNIDQENIERACNADSKAEVAAVVMDEGLANICLLTNSMNVLKQRVTKEMPKKRRGDNSGYEKAVRTFQKTVYDTMLRNIEINNLKAIIIASPGFVARNFYDYMFQRAADEGNKLLLMNKYKFMVTHSSTGHIQSMDEVLKNHDVSKQLSDTKYTKETQALDKFFKALNRDDGRAWYGPKHIQEAMASGAVDTLLLTDRLFRSYDVSTRKKYIQMVEDVRNTGGTAHIFSTLHESGEELDAMTGVAAILKYPMPELEDIEVEEDEEF